MTVLRVKALISTTHDMYCEYGVFEMDENLYFFVLYWKLFHTCEEDSLPRRDSELFDIWPDSLVLL